MPPIPDKVIIGNRTVMVQIGETPEGVMGFFDPQTFEIMISNKLESPMAIVETFWHELVHAVNDFNRFTVELLMEMQGTDTPEESAGKFEERMTEAFAKTFIQVIQDNNLLPIQ